MKILKYVYIVFDGDLLIHVFSNCELASLFILNNINNYDYLRIQEYPILNKF